MRLSAPGAQGGCTLRNATCYEDTSSGGPGKPANRLLGPKTGVPPTVALSRELCAQTCWNAKAALGGLEDGGQCFCAAEFNYAPVRVNSPDGCNIPCSAAANETCGGDGQIEVFEPVCSGAPVKPPPPPPPLAPPPPPPAAACTPGHETQRMPFCNVDLPRDARTWDLIGRLNLTEKAGLLTSSRYWVPRLGVHSLEGNECLHGLFNRGTPYGSLAIDGAATIFPQGIGLGATWNRTLLRGMGEVISTEAVAKRNEHRRNNRTEWPFYLTCWAPVINIVRGKHTSSPPALLVVHIMPRVYSTRFCLRVD